MGETTIEIHYIDAVQRLREDLRPIGWTATPTNLAGGFYGIDVRGGDGHYVCVVTGWCRSTTGAIGPIDEGFGPEACHVVLTGRDGEPDDDTAAECWDTAAECWTVDAIRAAVATAACTPDRA